MKERLRRFLPATMVLVCGLLGYWLIRDAARIPPKPQRAEIRVPIRTEIPEEVPMPAKSAIRDEFPDGTTIEIFGSCREEEIILRFPSNASYGSFVNALAGSSVRLIDRLDRLRALRLGWTLEEKAALIGLFEGEKITTYKTLASLPEAPQAPGGAARGSAMGFGSQVLPWLGVSGDNSRWGAGVKVAVLDSGIMAHPALPRISRSVEIFPFPADPATVHGHGTAVASLIASHDPFAPGVAPAVDLISIRIIDESGLSDAFAVAAGILAAIDSGAEIINLSLGEQGDIPLLGDAIRMALDDGIVVVASSGNEGQQEAKYPAAYDGVIGVGAVDASGERMAFSNLGSGLGLTAPGYGVNAAAPGGGFVSISGTSASAPLVTGAIAATMSDGSGKRMGAVEAARIVMAYADDQGLPGFDTEYGSGVLNLGRIMSRSIPGLSDAAITCQRIVPAAQSGGRDEVQVTVQNRGTAILINTLIEISTPGGTTGFNATSIAPGAIQTFSAPFDRFSLTKGTPAQISSTVTPGNSATDRTPENNRLQSIFLPL